MLGIEYLMLRIALKIIFLVFLFVMFGNSSPLFIAAIMKERSLELTPGARNCIRSIVSILSASRTSFEPKVILSTVDSISPEYLLIS
jgi:hypothetical protein